MQYRLLDLLACPMDGAWPLEIESVITTSNTFKKDRRCQAICGFVGGGLTGTLWENCARCAEEQIESAVLICPDCGARYPVEKGIPRMLPAYLLETEASANRDQGDRLREIEARDRFADAYDEMKPLAWLSRIEKPLTMKLADIGPGDLVIELGAGTGRFTPEIAAAAAEVVAVDFSYESLRRCADKRHDDHLAHLVQADISHLPLRTGVFDKAVSCQVFEHLPSAEIRHRGIMEARRILKESGELTISVYRQFWYSRFFGPKEGYHDGHIYYYRFTPEEFLVLLKDCFDVIDHHRSVGLYIQIAKCRKRIEKTVKGSRQNTKKYVQDNIDESESSLPENS